MSRVAFSIPVAALCLGLVGGIPPVHARGLGQAGAIDGSTYNIADVGVSNMTRPTLVLPQREPARAATNPDNTSLGWSRLNGPYTSARGRPLAGPQPSDDMASSRFARR